MADHMPGFPRVCPVIVLLLAAGCAGSATEQPSPPSNSANAKPTNATVHVPPQAANLTQTAAGVPAPVVVRAMSFKTSTAQLKGWKITIPGQRPLATPAIADGKLFVGGGFGSHEFYAFDAATGKKVWQYQTADDGPTAAIVADGYVIFNTESCELEVLTLDGKPVWKKRLGDPLMSMPAAQGGRIFMAYPDSNGTHSLVCFDLKSGTELWKQPIPGEVITSPVIDDNRVLAATLEGTLRCFDQRTGKVLWSEVKNATSSPTVWRGGCYFSRREARAENKAGSTNRQQTELVAARNLAGAGEVRDYDQTAAKADYLDYNKRAANSPVEKQLQDADTDVGFPGSMKGAAKIAQSMTNLGQASVSGVWSYQGSKPIMTGGNLYIAMGKDLECVTPETGKILWKKSVGETAGNGRQSHDTVDAQLTPPAAVNGKLFLGTRAGRVMCVSAAKGNTLWTTDVGEPIVFQAAVAGGRIYFGTAAGSLIAIETGDAKDDGWLMWGANAAHNGLPARVVR